MLVATKLLAGRDKTSAQLAAALQRKGHDSATITQTIERAKALKYLDDARVAARLALDELRGGWAGEALHARLTSKGLDDALVSEACASAITELGWVELDAARSLMTKRKLEGAKAARFLGGRGFSADVVERLVGSAEVER